MSTHLSSEQIQGYRERKLSAEEFLLASDHLSVCEPCRGLIGTPDRTRLKFTSLRDGFRSEAAGPPMHLEYEQLAAYVDRATDPIELEIIQSHLEACPRCAAEASELEAFRADQMTHQDAAHSSLQSRFSALWRRPLFRLPVQFATAAAAIVIIAAVATLPLRKQVAELRARLEAVRHQNDDLQQQASKASELQAKLDELQRAQSNTSTQVAEALYDAGRTLEVDDKGNITGFESLPPQIEESIQLAAANNHQEVSAELRGVITKAGTLMGGSGEGISFALLSPVGTMVKSAHPMFRWRALAGASSYSVDVFDSDMKSVARVDRVSGTNWTPAQSLERHQAYTWQVTAIRNGEELTSPVPPAPEAKFKILEQSKADELNRAIKAYPNSHLILGALYVRAGLLDDAESEFRSLVSANPKSTLARKLLQNLKSLRQR